jgi:hypothetical protein
MITYKSRFLTRAEVWYDDEADDSVPADWIVYYRRSRPLPGAKTLSICTYAIDLTLTEEQLRANLKRDTACKIRRARDRDKIVCEVCDPCDPAVMDRFEEMYNIFAPMKGLLPLCRPKLDNMAAQGLLDLTAARHPDGKVLVYHANYRDSRRATGMEVPSLYRQLADSSERNLNSRANRLLTWADILRYKAQGLKCFDFGGWYEGDDAAQLSINNYKQGFGGMLLREYQCEEVRTLKGWLVLRAADLLRKAKLLSSSQPQPATERRVEAVYPQIPLQADLPPPF